MRRLLAYLQLLRLPTVFTAMADIFLGFLLVQQTLRPVIDFCLLLAASSCLYLAGMVFNDVFDRKIDARERPGRPIPSGRVPLMSAVRLGILLVAAGIGAANVAGPGSNSLIVAGILTVVIFAYDGVLKLTVFGPLAMGMCRFLNVMLGASAVETAAQLWKLPQLHVAGGIALYIVGVTWFARREAKLSLRTHLLAATLVINLGLAGLLGYILGESGYRPIMVLLVMGVIMLTINRRLAAALFQPIPEKVQPAVKTLLLSLIMLDATLVLFSTGESVYAIGTAALLVPALVLGRWLPVT